MALRLLLAACWVLCGWLSPADSSAAFVASPITSDNAASLLFGGSDAVGGVGDFYLSNGVVEAVIDGVGPQQDLLTATGISVPRQNSVSPTGGTLVDLARTGADNDQLAQNFIVVGIDSNQIPRTTSVEAAVEADAAVVRSTGTVPFDPDGPGPLGAVSLGIVTEYRAEGTRPALTVRTTLLNTITAPVPLLNMFDAVVWTMKGPLPFTPLPGRGFHHHALPDLSMPQQLVPALELAPYLVAAGVLDERDGVIDAERSKTAGGVCYGLVSGGATLDVDGPSGPLPALPAVGPPLLFGINNTTASAVGFGGPNLIPPGGSFTYVRSIFVGTRSDVAACTDLIFDHFGLPTVEARGRVVDSSGLGVEASVAVSLLPFSTLPNLSPGAPLTQVRTAADGSFALRMPPGIYGVRATASERPAVEGTLIVGPEGVARLDLAPMQPPARIEVTVEVDGAPAPARVSFFREDGERPRIGKLFDVVTVDTGRPGVCAADSSRSCSVDGDCGAAAPCVRVCSLAPERRCASDLDCLPGQCVAGVDEQPESFGGGARGERGLSTAAQGSTLYTAEGQGAVELLPGRYRSVAARGIEYSIDDGGGEVIDVGAGEVRSVARAIARVAAVQGALSADFHIHSARSFDSSAPLVGRVLSFAAEGVEVMVSSDHDFHTDYAPVISAMGLGDRVASIHGNEVTTGTPPTVGNELKFGHMNGFPVPVLPTARRRGAIEDEFVSPNWIYRRLREQGAAVVQVNHPRAPLQQGSTGIGWFNNAGFDPSRPLGDPVNSFLLDTQVVPGSSMPHPGCSGLVENPAEPFCTSNIDFDTLEVANAARPGDFLAYRAVRRDWMSLLLQGVFKPATGVSDSHRLTVETPGYARTLVLGVGDEPRSFDRDRFLTAVRAGHMLVTSGPLVFVDAVRETARAGVGDTLVAPDGHFGLHVEVDAAPWIPVEEVRVLVNGVVVSAADVSAQGGLVRYDADVPLELPGDGFVVVEAGPRLPPDPNVSPPRSGTAPGGSIAYSDIVPGAISFAFTNPIFVDTGDPGYVAPGLPNCATAPTSVVCETAISLPADTAHDSELGFLTRLTIPEEWLQKLR